MYSTIASTHNLVVKVSTACSNGFACNGSEDSYLMFHTITNVSHDTYWTSSSKPANPYYLGKSGYFAINRFANASYDGSVNFHQRPALFTNSYLIHE